MADYAIPGSSIFSELVNFFQQRRENRMTDEDRAYRERVRQEVMKATGFTPEGGPSVQGFQINESNLTNADRARKSEDAYKEGTRQVGEAAALDYQSDPTRYPLTSMQLSGVMNRSPEIARTFIAQILGEREGRQNFTNQRILGSEQNQQAIERTAAAQKGELAGNLELQKGQQTFASTEAEKGRQFQTGQETRQAGGIYEVLKAMGINVPQTAGFAGPSAIVGLQRDPQTRALELQQLYELTKPTKDKETGAIIPPKLQPKQALQLMQQNSPNIGMEILKMLLQNDENMLKEADRDLLLRELRKTGIDPNKYFAPWNQ